MPCRWACVGLGRNEIEVERRVAQADFGVIVSVTPMALGLEQHRVGADVTQCCHLCSRIHLRERVRAVGPKMVVDKNAFWAGCCHGPPPVFGATDTRVDYASVAALRECARVARMCLRCAKVLAATEDTCCSYGKLLLGAHSLRAPPRCEHPLAASIHSLRASTRCEHPLAASIHSLRASTRCEHPLAASIHSLRASTRCEHPLAASIHSLRASTRCERPR